MRLFINQSSLTNKLGEILSYTDGTLYKFQTTNLESKHLD